MSLFQFGNFHLSSGDVSNFKIDCDALTDRDIETVAIMLKERLPNFGSVEGVPSGGLRLAKVMEHYITEGPLLIVDDVLTTGRSIERLRNGRTAIGAVIFSRKMVYVSWITSLFQMTPRRHQNNCG